MEEINIKKKLVDNWFNYLQMEIIKNFEFLEKQNSGRSKKFIKREWGKNIKKQGGGISFILNNGNIFDKVGVNKSTVSGTFSKSYRSNILGAKKKWKLLGFRSISCCSYEESKNTCFTF